MQGAQGALFQSTKPNCSSELYAGVLQHALDVRYTVKTEACVHAHTNSVRSTLQFLR